MLAITKDTSAVISLPFPSISPYILSGVVVVSPILPDDVVVSDILPSTPDTESLSSANAMAALENTRDEQIKSDVIFYLKLF